MTYDPVKAKAYRAACGDAIRKREREYRAWTRERRRAYAKAYYEKNKEVFLEYQRSRREHFNAYQRAHRKAHPELHRAWALARKDKVKNYYLIKNYGISSLQFQHLLEQQDNRCAICREFFVQGQLKHVDHDHITGLVRGILCGICNRGLGCFRDSEGRLQAAITYLRGSRDASTSV